MKYIADVSGDGTLIFEKVDDENIFDDEEVCDQDIIDDEQADRYDWERDNAGSD